MKGAGPPSGKGPLPPGRGMLESVGCKLVPMEQDGKGGEGAATLKGLCQSGSSRKGTNKPFVAGNGNTMGSTTSCGEPMVDYAVNFEFGQVFFRVRPIQPILGC